MNNRKGPKIGLVLGSGGPKGLAHIGVIKVLEKNNIPIDFIAGSSIGAMIGGFYAATKNIKEIEEIALNANWRQILSLIDPSFRQGLVGGKKIKEFIENYINKISFKKLKIPLSVIATDLKNGNPVIIKKGEVALAIRASISFPLIFRPVKYGHKLLADGGLSLPVPVDVIRNMGAELIIAVNLDAGPLTNKRNKIKFGFYRIADNSINILRHHLASCNIKNADLIINPKLGEVYWNKFLDGKDIILAGEKAMKKNMPELKKLI